MRFIPFKHIEAEFRLKLKDTHRTSQHIFPDSLVIPINFMRFRIRQASDLTSIPDNTDIFKTKDVVLYQRNIMNTIHIDLQNEFAVAYQYAIVVVQSNGACHDSCRVHRLRDWRIEQSIKVIEHIGVVFLCLVRIDSILFFDLCNLIQCVRVLLRALCVVLLCFGKFGLQT